MSIVLKNVAVTAFACQALEGQTWNELSTWANMELENGLTYNIIVSRITDVEKEMKKQYNVTSMPSSWRSAKAVLLKALRLDVKLFENGFAIGKTAVEALCKGVVSTSGASKLGQYLTSAKKSANLWTQLSETERHSVAVHLRWMNV